MKISSLTLSLAFGFFAILFNGEVSAIQGSQSHVPETTRAEAPKKDAERPNIVVFLADDMGWGDSAAYGHKITKTPNIDKLAAEGMKFTQGLSLIHI